MKIQSFKALSTRELKNWFKIELKNLFITKLSSCKQSDY